MFVPISKTQTDSRARRQGRSFVEVELSRSQKKGLAKMNVLFQLTLHTLTSHNCPLKPLMSTFWPRGRFTGMIKKRTVQCTFGRHHIRTFIQQLKSDQSISSQCLVLSCQFLIIRDRWLFFYFFRASPDVHHRNSPPSVIPKEPE